MAETYYQYSIYLFLNDKVNSRRLQQEIDDSLISSANYVRTDILGEETVRIWFDAALSIPDIVLLDAIVVLHDGTDLPGIDQSPAWGLHFQQANEDSQSSTSLSAWQDKVVMSTPTHFSAGTYIVQWYAECKCSLTSNLCAVCCRHIDVEHDEYLGAADLDVSHDASDVEVPFGGFKIISLTGGVHTFKIQFALSKGSGTVYIRKARMAIWRLA